MTGSEFAFLAMGLGLGVAAGAALLAFLRTRPSSSREVRITMTPGAIPRRHPSTLADAGLPDAGAPSAPARGGPADHDDDLPARPPAAPGSRTPVLDPGAAPVATPAFRLAEPMPRRAVAAVPPQSIAVSGGIDPMLAALRASAAASAEAAMKTLQATGGSGAAAGGGSVGVSAGVRPAAAATSSGRGNAGGDRVRADAGSRAAEGARSGGSAAADTASSAPDIASSATGPCGDVRRIADERCTLADRARAQATSAEDAHRAAQRAYDDHEAASAEAADAADARAVRRAKDDAQARFRAGRAAATTTDEVEAVARAWLLDINRINTAARDAASALARERERGQALALDLERTSLAADTARISAETAAAACLAAREALADCEERSASGRPGHVPAMPSDAPGDDAGGDDDGSDGDASEALSGALGGEGSPRVFRLLHGDRAAMHELVTALAGGDAQERRRWQIALSDLVDAIIADALAASALDFPSDHPFWGPFTRAQARDITAALSSLGYRFDGLGGWSDERIPSQRDLSLALGYAGLDPMRMRHWPTEREMTDLFAEVRVAAAEHLAGAAGDLMLGELVTMLGRRADGLADIWNEWGRIRPLLLEEA